MSFPNLQPGEWYEIPNSNLSSVLPSPLPPGATGPSAIVTAWNGALYDSKRSRHVLMVAGGHGDYAGNEVYSFDLVRWSRIWGPTTNAQIPGVTAAGTETYLDGMPASRHTYSGVQYLPGVDAYFVHGGSLWGGSGGMGKGTWLFGDRGWQRRADISTNSAVPFTVYDPANGQVYVHRYNVLYAYDVASNTSTKIGGHPQGISPLGTSVFDPIRRRFFLIGGGTRMYDMNTPPGNIQLQTITTTGDKTAENAKYPGAEYDPMTDTICCWAGGGAVYDLSPNFNWTKINPTNTVTPAAPPSTGTHSRWRYMSDNNLFIVTSSINANVNLYRHGGKAPRGVTNLEVRQ